MISLNVPFYVIPILAFVAFVGNWYFYLRRLSYRVCLVLLSPPTNNGLSLFMLVISKSWLKVVVNRKAVRVCSSIGPLVGSLVDTSTLVRSSYNGPGSNGNPPITEAIPKSLEKIFYIFCIGNKRIPCITDRYICNLPSLHRGLWMLHSPSTVQWSSKLLLCTFLESRQASFPLNCERK